MVGVVVFEDQQGQFSLQQRGFYPQLHTLPAITVLQTPEIGQGRSLFLPSRENVTFSRFFLVLARGGSGLSPSPSTCPKAMDTEVWRQKLVMRGL